MQIRDIRQTAWFWIDNSILDMGLSSNELAVYCLLVRMANKENKCYPSMRFVADKLKLGLTTVNEAIQRLSSNELKLIEVKSGGFNKPNNYTILAVTVGEHGVTAGGTSVPVDVQGVTVGDNKVLLQAVHNNTNITSLINNSDEVKTSSRKNKLLKPNKGVIEHFVSGYLKKTGNKYHFLPKDGKLIDDLISISGADEVVKRINNLFLSDEEFYKKAGYTVGVLYSCFNKLCDKPKSSTLRV